MKSITNIINFIIHRSIKTTNTHLNVVNAALNVCINKIVKRFQIIVPIPNIIIRSIQLQLPRLDQRYKHQQ